MGRTLIGEWLDRTLLQEIMLFEVPPPLTAVRFGLAAYPLIVLATIPVVLRLRFTTPLKVFPPLWLWDLGERLPVVDVGP